VQLLPFLELLAHSQRDTGFGSSEWSMPVWGWANFLVPLFRTHPTAQGLFLQAEQNWTSSYYAGVGTILLVAVAVRRVRDWRVWLLAALFFLSLVLSLGDQGLLYRALRFCLPMVGFARYPIKFVILTLAVAPLLAAFGLQALTRRATPMGRFEWACGLGILLLIGMIVALAGKGPVPDYLWAVTWHNGLARAGLFVLVLVITGGLLKSLGHRRILFGCLLLVAFWVDFMTHVPTQNPTVRPWVYSPGWGNEHRQWNAQPRLGQSRAMLSPAAEEVIRPHQLPNLEENYLISRLALFANCNLLDNVPQVYGFFSLAPGEANDATCIPYVRTNSDFAVLLDFMGVSQITAPGTVCNWAPRPTAMPIVTVGQKPLFADDQTVINAFAHTNVDLRRIVFLPPEARGGITATQRTAAHALATQFANQKISIQTEAAAASLVVIAQSYYPAWKAYVDGRPAKIWRANYAFQAVQVPPGHHQLRLVYEDSRLLIGAVLSGLGLLACLGLWLLAHIRKTAANTT
jgi:hypothetical protein